MTLNARDKRKIATASLEQIEPDERTGGERVLDNISDLSDEFDWNWNQLDEDSAYTFQLQKDRYTISVLFDETNGGIEDAKLEIAIRSDVELYQAIRDI